MEKGRGPQHEIPAPPYPGPPLNQNPIGQQVVVVRVLPTDAPGEMMCPHCRKNVVTEVVYKNGSCTWLCCTLIGCFLCWPCCWIPFCVKDFKDVEHSCPDCHKLLHFHKRR